MDNKYVYIISPKHSMSEVYSLGRGHIGGSDNTAGRGPKVAARMKTNGRYVFCLQLLMYEDEKRCFADMVPSSLLNSQCI